MSNNGPPLKWLQVYKEESPGAGPSVFPRCYIEPGSDSQHSTGYMWDGLYVEPFPVSTAGAPIATTHKDG
ncbi:hypothetical protein FRC11_010542, partial [Ceratobasidium sp. 423]